MSNDKANAEILDLLADFNSSFGKKAKARTAEPAHKALNKAFHAANPQGPNSARGQLDRMKIENYYDWEMHLANLKNIDVAQAVHKELTWLPEAQVAFIIHQTCGCCKETVTFVGNEYIRFRGMRRRWKDLRANEYRWTYPTMLKRVAEVDGNLIAYGLPDGNPLPDFTEELTEQVRRCASCINLERRTLELWNNATERNPNAELVIEFKNDDGSVTRI